VTRQCYAASFYEPALLVEAAISISPDLKPLDTKYLLELSAIVQLHPKVCSLAQGHEKQGSGWRGSALPNAKSECLPCHVSAFSSLATLKSA